MDFRLVSASAPDSGFGLTAGRVLGEPRSRAGPPAGRPPDHRAGSGPVDGGGPDGGPDGRPTKAGRRPGIFGMSVSILAIRAPSSAVTGWHEIGIRIGQLVSGNRRMLRRIAGLTDFFFHMNGCYLASLL